MKYLEDAVITDVDLISDLYSSEGNGGKRRNRQRGAIIVKYEGKTLYTAKNGEFISSSTNIAVLPKGSDYEWRCIESGHYLSLEFDTEATETDIFTVPVKSSEQIVKLIKDAIERRKSPNYKKSEALRDAYEIIVRLIKNEHHHYAPGDKQRKIAPALEYISENYTGRITNEELARVTGISCAYMRRLFKEVTGTSPIDYAIGIKIKRAEEMLRTDCGGISDVALALGFDSIYDFSRTFKKRVGISPRKFKEKYE
jgi:AraC-like DNA-binding protein